MRTALYLAAMSGVRCNPPLRALYRRLVAAGTPKQAALTAAAHKRLTILDTVAHDGTTWSPPTAAPACPPGTIARQLPRVGSVSYSARTPSASRSARTTRVPG